MQHLQKRGGYPTSQRSDAHGVYPTGSGRPEWGYGKLRCADVRTRSRGCNAAQIEAEEGVGVAIETDLGVGGIGGVGRARVGAGKTFVVDADVHRLDGAEG